MRGGAFSYLIIDIQHAPLQSNTTCFRVKYPPYGYVYFPVICVCSVGARALVCGRVCVCGVGECECVGVCV